MAVLGLRCCTLASLVVVSGGYSSLQCMGFSLRWLVLLQSTGSRCVGFSSCAARVQLLRGMWNLPGPGLEPVSPALAGGFLTTSPPGKSWQSSLLVFVHFMCFVKCIMSNIHYCIVGGIVSLP